MAGRLGRDANIKTQSEDTFPVNSVCVCPDVDPHGNSQRKCVSSEKVQKKKKKRKREKTLPLWPGDLSLTLLLFI